MKRISSPEDLVLYHARRGDRSAFFTLFEPFFRKSYSNLRMKGHSRTEAEAGISSFIEKLYWEFLKDDIQAPLESWYRDRAEELDRPSVTLDDPDGGMHENEVDEAFRNLQLVLLKKTTAIRSLRRKKHRCRAAGPVASRPRLSAVLIGAAIVCALGFAIVFGPRIPDFFRNVSREEQRSPAGGSGESAAIVKDSIPADTAGVQDTQGKHSVSGRTAEPKPRRRSAVPTVTGKRRSSGAPPAAPVSRRSRQKIPAQKKIPEQKKVPKEKKAPAAPSSPPVSSPPPAAPDSPSPSPLPQRDTPEEKAVRPVEDRTPGVAAVPATGPDTAVTAAPPAPQSASPGEQTSAKDPPSARPGGPAKETTPQEDKSEEITAPAELLPENRDAPADTGASGFEDAFRPDEE